MLIGTKDTFAFELHPVQPGWVIEHPAEAAAWVGLSIWIGGMNTCAHVEPHGDRIAEVVHVPLGPIADWLVRSWPALTYETHPPERPPALDARAAFARWMQLEAPKELDAEAWYDARERWWSRHFLQAGAQGAVVPDLAFVREAEHVAISWASVATRDRQRRSDLELIRWKELAAIVRELVAFVQTSFQREGAAHAYPWLTQADPLNAQLEGMTHEQRFTLFTGRSPAELASSLSPPAAIRLNELVAQDEQEPQAALLAQLVRDLPGGTSASVIEPLLDLTACVSRSWTPRSEHCGHPDRSIVDTEIGAVDSEIAVVNAEIGVVDSEIGDRV